MDRRLSLFGEWSQGNPIAEILPARAARQILLMTELGVVQSAYRHRSAFKRSVGLIDILEKSRHASSTDDHDRIFALLGLSR
jgi:hypothetical protein